MLLCNDDFDGLDGLLYFGDLSDQIATQCVRAVPKQHDQIPPSLTQAYQRQSVLFLMECAELWIVRNKVCDLHVVPQWMRDAKGDNRFVLRPGAYRPVSSNEGVSFSLRLSHG